MGYELDLQRGADIQLTGSHSTVLNTVDAYAVHLRYAEGDKKVFAKYSNKTVTGYEKRLFNLSFDEKVEYLRDLEENNVIKFEIV